MIETDQGITHSHIKYVCQIERNTSFHHLRYAAFIGTLQCQWYQRATDKIYQCVAFCCLPCFSVYSILVSKHSIDVAANKWKFKKKSKPIHYLFLVALNSMRSIPLILPNIGAQIRTLSSIWCLIFNFLFFFLCFFFSLAKNHFSHPQATYFEYPEGILDILFDIKS